MNKNIVDRIIAPIGILIIIVAGFFGLFSDHSLFVDEDVVLLFQENSLSNKVGGWRPDILFTI